MVLQLYCFSALIHVKTEQEDVDVVNTNSLILLIAPAQFFQKLLFLVDSLRGLWRAILMLATQ